MSLRFPVWLGWLVLVVLGFASPGCSGHEGGPAGAGGGTARTAMTASLRMAVLRARQKAAGYDFVRDANGTRRARAGGHGATAEVTATARGVRLEGDGGLHLGVETASVGRGTARTSLGVRGQRAEGQELVLDREDEVEERYLAGPLGLEQSYVVGARPEGRGPLSIEVAFAGLAPERVAGATDQVLLRDEAGRVRAGYRDLAAVDAEGRELAARMEVRAGGVALVIDDAGAAYPLRVDPVVWVQQAQLTASDGAAQDQFGGSVAVSGDTAIVGALDHTVGSNAQQGAAYVFVRSGTTWPLQAELTASDGGTYDGFGKSVALNGDTAIVGAVSHTVGSHAFQGAAYIFVRSGTTWTQQAELTASDGAASDDFGVSVAVSGGTAIVGAVTHTVGGNVWQGAAYIFVRSGTTWTQQAELTASDGAAQDQFGVSVAVSGGTAIVGALGHSAAYVFVQSGTTWTQQAELTGGAYDDFGCAVALSGDTAIVGAYYHDVAKPRGAAYVFVQSGTAWTQQAVLTAGDGAAGDRFGFSVALSGDTAVVGAHQHTVGSNALQGAAYIFVRSGTTWTQQAELTASDGAANDAFGASVAVSGDTAIVGSDEHEVGSNALQGAAYVFVAGNGAPCASDAACQSGSCVDGVCCDTPCGGGVATDCLSCLGAMTGGTDGTCGTVKAGAMYTCRAATGTCHVAAVCTGSSAACPAEGDQPNGTACDDGDACTQTDTCQAGECTGSSPVVCTASDECHDAGTCDKTTGTCSNPAKADGTACSEGVCMSGACTATASSSSSSTSASSGGGAGGAGGAGGQPATTSSTTSTSSSGGAPEILPGCACVPGSLADRRGGPGGLAWSALALALASRRRRKGRDRGRV